MSSPANISKISKLIIGFVCSCCKMLGRSVVKFKFDYSSQTWVKLNVIHSDKASQVFGYDVSDFQISGLNYLEMVSQIKCFNTLYLKYLLVSIWMLSHQLALPTSSAPSLHVCHLHHRQYDSLMITQSYFKDRWNMFDFITVLGSIVDALMVEFAVRAKKLFPFAILKSYVFKCYSFSGLL